MLGCHRGLQLIHRLDTELVAQRDRGARPDAWHLQHRYKLIGVLGAELVEHGDVAGVDELADLFGRGVSDTVDGA